MHIILTCALFWPVLACFPNRQEKKKKKSNNKWTNTQIITDLPKIHDSR